MENSISLRILLNTNRYFRFKRISNVYWAYWNSQYYSSERKQLTMWKLLCTAILLKFWETNMIMFTFLQKILGKEVDSSDVQIELCIISVIYALHETIIYLMHFFAMSFAMVMFSISNHSPHIVMHFIIDLSWQISVVHSMSAVA